MISSIIAAALRQRLILVIVALVLAGFGINAAQHLSVDAFPDVANVQVQIATESDGKSPEEIERFVTIPTEIAMTGLPGMTDMRSLNKPGLSLITLVFADGNDLYRERQMVSERLAELRDRMPAGVTPVLGPITNALGEVYQYTLERTGEGESKRPLSREELIARRTAQDWSVRPLLRSISGVAEINSTGGFVKQYETLVDPQKLHYYNLGIDDVLKALSRNNANAGGGVLPQHAEQYLIRSVGLIRNLDDIRNIVLKESGATPIYMRDVADVRLGTEVRYGAMIKNGYTEAVGGVVLMTSGGNAKEIVSRVKERVAEINAKHMLPDGLQIVPYYDRSQLVDAAIGTVTEVLAEGVGFVVVILFLFLGDIRSSLIVSTNLILTPLLTFSIMNAVGLGANLMSLGGLAIAIGLMVDGSVVVVENVFAKLSHAGHDHTMTTREKLQLILAAVNEVATPTLFGVTIIILVFVPLMTLQGMEGKMFAPLAYTIAIALAISLVLSLTLSPVLSSYLLKGGSEEDTWLVRLLRRPYNRMLAWTIDHRRASVILVAVLFLGALSLFPFLGTSFIPEMAEGTLSPNADRVPNISLAESLKMERSMQQQMLQVPGVVSVVSRVGRGESPADPAGPNEADVLASLTPFDERPRGMTQDGIAEQIRKRLISLPGINLVMSQPISDRVDEMVSGVRADVAVMVYGEDLDVLVAKANAIAKVATGIQGTQDTRVDRVGGQQYLTIDIQRGAIARYGLNAADVNDVIETAIAGKTATDIYEGEKRFSGVVRLPLELRDSVEDIRQLLISSPDGPRIPLSELATVKVVEGPALINRSMGKRRIVVGLNVHDRDLGGYVKELQSKVDRQVSMPAGYTLEWGGQFHNMERALHHLMIIVPITVAAIFFLLFVLFRSLRFAALIITVLPLASIGGIIGLFVTREYLSVPASVGFIALWGIAVLNGVVLVSYIRKLRHDGMDQATAVREGTRLRFRPVMMTATVAALGLVPFLFSHGPGSEIQRPLAIVVIGGLLSSTALTLLLVPTIYGWFEGNAALEEEDEAL
ncbi:MAG: efflux RND transporter permease subunit [Janthinobacterium lividum]